MTWWMASILANVGIAVVEYLNRTQSYEGFHNAVMVTGPFILVAQYGLWRAWDGAPSFMLAWAFFTACNGLLRLISAQWFVGEGLNLTTMVGVSVIYAGVYLIKVGS